MFSHDVAALNMSLAGPSNNLPEFAIERILKRRTWFYSPAVGHYVRREDVNFSTGGRSVRSLLAALPAASANEVRIRSIISAWENMEASQGAP